MSTKTKEVKKVKTKKSDIDNIRRLYPCLDIPLDCGETVSISPIKIKKLSVLYDIIEDLGKEWFDLFGEANVEKDEDGNTIAKDEAVFVKKIAKLFVSATDGVTTFLTLGTGKDADFIGDLSLNDGVSLFEGVIKINNFDALAKKAKSLVEKTNILQSVPKP